MHPSLRPLLLATGAFFATALTASAQFEPLLTEAPVTLQATLTTSTVTSTETERRSAVVISRLSHQQILQDIVGNSDSGWTLVAVRYVPADLTHVDAGFRLFAVNGEERNEVDLEKFEIRALGSVAKYRERHIGQYVLTSSGTVTNHVAINYRPSLASGTNTVTALSSLGDGFATINYATRDSLGNQEVFFYLINSIRAVVRGGLRLDTEQDALLSLTINVGAPKLVLASTYPSVESEPPGILTENNR